MKQTQTTRGLSYGALSSQSEAISSSEGKKICETAPGIPKHFVAPSVGVSYGNPDTCITKQTIRKRRNGLLSSSAASSPEETEFTALEYLESSGTQYIETQLEVDATWGATVEWEMTHVADYANVMSAGNTGSGGKPINAGSFSVPYWNGVVAPFYASFMNNGEHFYALNARAEMGVRYVSHLNFRNSRNVKLNEESLGVIPEGVKSFTCKNPVLFGVSRSGTTFYGARLIGKIFRVQISKGAALKMYLVPVLNAEGVPGMFDKVSKQFFANHGTGTFGYSLKGQGASQAYSLRARNSVLPSGVYARKVDELNPEILADTEAVSGVGWEWFANTAEAYARFGFVQEENF